MAQLLDALRFKRVTDYPYHLTDYAEAEGRRIFWPRADLRVVVSLWEEAALFDVVLIDNVGPPTLGADGLAPD